MPLTTAIDISEVRKRRKEQLVLSTYQNGYLEVSFPKKEREIYKEVSSEMGYKELSGMKTSLMLDTPKSGFQHCADKLCDLGLTSLSSVFWVYKQGYCELSFPGL